MKKTNIFNNNRVKNLLQNTKFRGALVLLAIITVVVSHPKGPFAALLPQEFTMIKTVSTSNKSETISQVDSGKAVTKEDKNDEKTKVETDINNKEIQKDSGGVDLRNDPAYIEELKQLYSDEDIDRLYAPRKWVTMPNVIGLSEADALKKMRSLGLVPRIVYEDSGKKEGFCFQQEIAGGTEWNTDASIFIWIQRADKQVAKPSVEKPVVTTKPTETEPVVKKPVIVPSPVESTENVEPVNQPTETPIVPHESNINQPTVESNQMNP